MYPLPPRSAPAGRNPGPESFEEVDPILANFFKDGSIQVSDSAWAFKKSAAQGSRPAASVNHTKGQFSACAKLPLKKMTPKTKACAERRSSTSSSSLRVTASTNMAEGYIGNAKQALAKRGLLGGGAAKQATLNTLAAAWLFKSPGLQKLGAAMRKFVAKRLKEAPPDACFEPFFLEGL